MIASTAAAGGTGSIGLFLLVIAAGAAYLIPSIIAVARHHQQVGAIIVINLFLGWSFIGWVIAFAMSLSAVKTHP